MPPKLDAPKYVITTAKKTKAEVLLMQYIITIAGAIQLAGWFMALIEAIEKPPAPKPSKAKRREP